MLSFCNQTRKISAGTKNGQIIIYDLRTLKSQVVVAHQGAVSALCFSPSGKYLATYSQGTFFLLKIAKKNECFSRKSTELLDNGLLNIRNGYFTRKMRKIRRHGADSGKF